MVQTSQNIVSDKYLKNRLAFLNSNALFEFFGQFTIGCISYLSKNVLIVTLKK